MLGRRTGFFLPICFDAVHERLRKLNIDKVELAGAVRMFDVTALWRESRAQLRTGSAAGAEVPASFRLRRARHLARGQQRASLFPVR